MAAVYSSDAVPRSPGLSPIRSAGSVRVDLSGREGYRTPSPPADLRSAPGVLQSTPQPSRNWAALSLTSQLSNMSVSICRICHDTDLREELISPCRCSGTMGLIHRSCIEKWLGASNSDRCEICNFRYITERSPRPFVDWLRQPSRATDRRNLLGDAICFVLLTPLACVSAWLCITGAMHYSRFDANTWESAGLVTLSIFLVLIYLVWCAVAIRYHIRVYGDWRRRNVIVKVVNLSDVVLPSLPSRNSENESSTAQLVPRGSCNTISSLSSSAEEEVNATVDAGPANGALSCAAPSNSISAGQVWSTGTRSVPVKANRSDSVVYLTLHRAGRQGTFTRLVRETYV